MPQIQIIGQEKLQARMGARDREIQRQQISQQAYEKSMQFKQMSEQLKLQAKEVENEAEKIRITRLGDRMIYMSKIFERAADASTPEMAQNIIKWALQSDGKGITTDMSDPSVAKLIESFQPSAESQQRMANANLVNKIARDPQFSGIDGQPIDNQPRMNALSGSIPAQEQGQGQLGGDNIGWSSFSPPGSGLQLENYAGQARGAAMKTRATAQATRDIEMEPIKTSVTNYLNTFNRAVEEMGGMETSALAALAKGKTAEVSAQIGNMPNVFTLSKLIEPVSLQLGSYLNRGRPTDKDQEAAKNTLTRVTYTKGVNEILKNYLIDIISNGNKELATKLFWSLALAGGSKSPDARAYGDKRMLDTSNPTKRFTIRVKE